MFNIQVFTQTNDHNLMKNVATNAKFILSKTEVMFENCKLNILCKIAVFYKQKWLNKVIYFDFLSN